MPGVDVGWYLRSAVEEIIGLEIDEYSDQRTLRQEGERHGNRGPDFFNDQTLETIRTSINQQWGRTVLDFGEISLDMTPAAITELLWSKVR